MKWSTVATVWGRNGRPHGDVEAALAGTCRRLDGWRRLAGNADSLIVTMYAAAGIQGDGRSAAGDARSARELLVELPEGLRGPGRAVRIAPDGGHLRIELFDTRRESHWRIPLPPDLQVQPVTP